MSRKLIIVSGHAAAGKTTISKKIADEFRLPLVSVDAIKETVWDCLGFDQERDNWDRIGKMSFELMYYFIDIEMAKSKSLVAEAHFDPALNNDRLNALKEKYGYQLFQIHCYADMDVLQERFCQRMNSKEYHEGHKNVIKNIYSEEDFFSKIIGNGDKLLNIDGETYKVDTTNPEKINYQEIFEFIKKPYNESKA